MSPADSTGRGTTRPTSGRRAARRLAAAVAAAVALTSCGRADEPDPAPTAVAEGGTLTASPLDEPPGPVATAPEPAEAEPTPAVTQPEPTEGEGADGTAGPTDGAGETEVGDNGAETPSEEPSDPAPTGPTDADRARFVAEYRPNDAAELQHVAADTTGDGDRELVFAWVGAVSGVSHVALAAWDGTSYAIAWQDEGGPADQLARIRVADVNADGRSEVVVVGRRGEERSSANVWAVEGPSTVTALVAEGGCHDGSTTFGVAGVSFVAGAGGAEEIHATCDESPLPPDSWREEVYVWQDGAYRVPSTGDG